MTQPTTHDSARRPTYPRWAVAFACWLVVIWGHSLVQGPQSTMESDLVVSALRPLFEAVGVADPTTMSLVVRKGAHFLEYAALGVLGRGMLHARRLERGSSPFPAALMVPLVAVADECLQLFVPGRSGMPSDVLIDLGGLVAGALVGCLVSAALDRRRA